jgi:DDE superfamily endonuclease
VFANSYLKSNLEKFLGPLPSTDVPTRTSTTSLETQYENIPAFILADSAYPSTSRVVPTFKNNECNRNRDIKKLNAKLAGIRYCVENAFGICKGRFRLLNRPLESAKEDVSRSSYIITSIFALHNFLIDQCDDTPIDAEQNAVDTDAGNGSRSDADANGDEDINEQGNLPTRNILLRHMNWLNSNRS